MSTTDQPDNILYCAELPDGISEFTEEEMKVFATDLYARLISAMNITKNEDVECDNN
jgi:hypothetical protein